MRVHNLHSTILVIQSPYMHAVIPASVWLQRVLAGAHNDSRIPDCIQGGVITSTT